MFYTVNWIDQFLARKIFTSIFFTIWCSSSDSYFDFRIKSQKLHRKKNISQKQCFSTQLQARHNILCNIHGHPHDNNAKYHDLSSNSIHNKTEIIYRSMVENSKTSCWNNRARVTYSTLNCHQQEKHISNSLRNLIRTWYYLLYLDWHERGKLRFVYKIRVNRKYNQNQTVFFFGCEPSTNV